MHRYEYNDRDFRWKVTGTAAFCVVAGLYSVLMICRGNLLFWVFPPVCIYQLWNTFATLSNPKVVEVGDGTLRFTAYGRSHSYRLEEITLFLMKELEPHGKFYLRVEDSGGRKGRYWLPCKYMENGAELWDWCAWMEHQKDPGLLKFRARTPPGGPLPGPGGGNDNSGGNAMNIEQKILGEMCFGEELVVLDLAAASDLEVLDQMAARMLAEGMVKESYAAAIKKRESVYATGLELPEMGIAIPHTDPEHVNTPALCLGILREPVSFGAMGMADQRVDVRVVFMLSIKEPHAQLKVLQALMKVFQEEGRLTALTACATPKEAADKLRELLAG